MPVLRKILCWDAILGGSTAIIGLCMPGFMSPVLGLAQQLIFTIALVTLLYAIAATGLASRKQIPAGGVRLLVAANWIWTLISVVLLALHVKEATALGIAFLVLQIIVVGGLAYLEGNQLVPAKE